MTLDGVHGARSFTLSSLYLPPSRAGWYPIVERWAKGLTLRLRTELPPRIPYRGLSSALKRTMRKLTSLVDLNYSCIASFDLTAGWAALTTDSTPAPFGGGARDFPICYSLEINDMT